MTESRLLKAIVTGLLFVVMAPLEGCGRDESPDRSPVAAGADEVAWRYQRSLTFVTWTEDGIATAPFSFRTRPRGERYEREARAWLARGDAWDAFVEDSWSAPAVGGVWRIVPHGELRMAAGGAGTEALWYDSGGRRLRLDVGDPVSSWHGGERERFRLLDGTLTVGPEPSSGLVVEELQIARPAADGTPGIVHDRMVLLDEEGFALYLLHERTTEPGNHEARSTAWTLPRGAAEALREGRVQWVEVRPLNEARRDIPLHWRFEAEGAGVQGEITSTGYHSTIGVERGGRRNVELQYTVEGWLERGGERVEVVGIVRHEQR